MARVLVVDDEESLRHAVQRMLVRAGFEVLTAVDGQEALAVLGKSEVEVVVTDLRMPKVDGHELFRRVAEVAPRARTILMTAHGNIADAVKAMQAGAESYLAKPFEREELVIAVERAAKKVQLERENAALRERLVRGSGDLEILGSSPALREALERVQTLASRDGLVLITGESGAGKDLLARAIHRASPRAKGPFVAVHCGALPAGLLEPELFGVEAGAFTGASESRAGYVERAAEGTLFLDEVGELPLAAQVSVLRFLADGEIVRVGGGVVRRPDVRIVAATQRDLRLECLAGRFREDLFFRLNVLPLRAPPLRERREDIPVLFRAFLQRMGRQDLEPTEELIATLMARSWPGNVRELQNLAERLACLAEGPRLDLVDLPEDIEGLEPVAPRRAKPYRLALDDFERGWLADLLRRTGGNISEASRQGGIPRATLHARLKSLGLDAREPRP